MIPAVRKCEALPECAGVYKSGNGCYTMLCGSTRPGFGVCVYRSGRRAGHTRPALEQQANQSGSQHSRHVWLAGIIAEAPGEPTHRLGGRREWRPQSDGPALCPCSDPIRASVSRPTSPPLGSDVEFVVSFCSQRLAFLSDLRDKVERVGLTVVRVTVISKCGNVPMGAGGRLWLPNLHINVLQVPNVGRCDHSWALYILDRHHTLASRVLMLKDTLTDRGHILRPKRIERVLEEAVTARGGFVCLYEPYLNGAHPNDHLRWHARERLVGFALPNYTKVWHLHYAMNRTFQHGDNGAGGHNDTAGRAIAHRKAVARLFRSATRPMRRWADAIGASALLSNSSVAPRFVPVCYGGGFLTTSHAIRSVPRDVWRQVARSMSRADNVEASRPLQL